MDRDRLRRVGRLQAQPAAAARMQVAGVQGVAVAGQAMAAVVVELRGHEMELQVAASSSARRLAHEAAGLGDVASCPGRRGGAASARPAASSLRWS